MMSNTIITFVFAFALIANSLSSCQRAAITKATSDGRPENQMTDQYLLEQVAAFASSDPLASSNAWKILRNRDRQLLIEELKRLSSETFQNDFHRVMISFLLCNLDYEYQVNRGVVLSGIQEGAPFKRPYGDWGASLVRRLMVRGDPKLVAELFEASKWSDGAMSAELAYAYSEALVGDPSLFLNELQNKDEKVREIVLGLLTDNTLSAEDMTKVKSYLSSQCHDSSAPRLACETLKALNKAK